MKILILVFLASLLLADEPLGRENLEPRVKQLEAEVSQLKKADELLNKVLASYQQKFYNCDSRLTVIQAHDAPTSQQP